MSERVEVFVTEDGATGRRLVNAAVTPVPGLVVNMNVRQSGWCVTHRDSGVSVAKAPDSVAAMRLAIALGPVCDWTLPAHVIQRRPTIRRRWREVIEESGATDWQAGNVATAAELKSVAS